MSELLDVLPQAYELLVKHAAGLGWLFTSMLVGQVMAHRVFTKANAFKKRKSQWFWWWGRKTLPLHPLGSGLLLGIFWRAPEGVRLPVVQSMAYFGVFGALSVWGYQVLKGLAAKKGVDLDEAFEDPDRASLAQGSPALAPVGAGGDSDRRVARPEPEDHGGEA